MSEHRRCVSLWGQTQASHVQSVCSISRASRRQAVLRLCGNKDVVNIFKDLIDRRKMEPDCCRTLRGLANWWFLSSPILPHELGTPRKHSHATSGHVGKPGSNFNNPTAVGQHVRYKYAAFLGASCHVIAFPVQNCRSGDC